MAGKSTTIRFLLLYGLALGSLSSLMAWSRYHFLVIDHITELYVLLVAVIFVLVGVWVGRRWSAPDAVEKAAFVDLSDPGIHTHPSDLQLVEHPEISRRELDVLTQLARGYSNEEIANNLFVSTNTVKTHLSNLYVKLDVKRRTQAIDKARQLGLIP